MPRGRPRGRPPLRERRRARACRRCPQNPCGGCGRPGPPGRRRRLRHSPCAPSQPPDLSARPHLLKNIKVPDLYAGLHAANRHHVGLLTRARRVHVHPRHAQREGRQQDVVVGVDVRLAAWGPRMGGWVGGQRGLEGGEAGRWFGRRGQRQRRWSRPRRGPRGRARPLVEAHAPANLEEHPKTRPQHPPPPKAMTPPAPPSPSPHTAPSTSPAPSKDAPVDGPASSYTHTPSVLTSSSLLAARISRSSGLMT
jgi:hypothetical protein